MGTPRLWTSLATLVGSLFLSTQVLAFSLSDVDVEAKKLSAKSFSAPSAKLPKELADLKGEDYKKIKFLEKTAQWHDRKSLFHMDLMHLGSHYQLPVKINEVTATSVRPIKYDPKRFDFGDLKLPEGATKDLDYAGFNISYPINNKKRYEEVLSMLGATYFRAIGKGQVFGISARGLAIDTALPSGEEYPFFREFWIEQPKPKDHFLTIYALMDSPRATGAYRFILREGKEAVIDVRAKIYLRSEVGKLGLAPLTSMFLFGSNQPAPVADYRPELHDSDGLAIENGNGEWLYRPLSNPQRLSVSAFMVENPKAWGLLQRNRQFASYQDLDEHYEKRPSVWIEPTGNWGKGHIELVEIPSPDETNGNIVVFWSPDQIPVPGQPLEINYRTYWTNKESAHHDRKVAWVKQTRMSLGEVKRANLNRQPDGSKAFIIDFVGPSLSELPRDSSVTSDVTLDDNTEIAENRVRYNPETKGWRLTLRVKQKDPAKVADLSAKLVKDGKPISETWVYQLAGKE